MGQPFLSVCIPTFNRAESLCQNVGILIDQILKSTEKGLVEIVISDNASEDSTQSQVVGLKKRYPHIIYIRNEKNIGFDRNLDNTLRLAQGEYIWTLSDDDAVKNDAVAIILDVLKKFPHQAYYCMDTSKVTCEVKIFKNGNEWLKTTNLMGGLLSQNIFKRESLPKDRERYYGNYWFHFSIAYEMLATHAGVLMQNVLKEEKSSDVCRWAEGGKALTTYTCLKKVIAQLPEFGYDQILINSIVKKMVFQLPKVVASAKLYGLPVSAQTILYLFHEFKNYPFMLVLALLTLFVPTRLLKFFRHFYRKLC